MVSCIRVQQLTVKCISGKPQTNSDKSVSKIHHSHSRNPAQGLIDAQQHVKQQKVPAVFKSDWLRRQRFTSANRANGGGGGGRKAARGEPGTHTAPSSGPQSTFTFTSSTHTGKRTADAWGDAEEQASVV